MSKEQDEVAINLLFEIYDAGIGRKSVDLTGYLEDIKQALNIADVVFSETEVCNCKEPYVKITLLKCTKCDRLNQCG